MHLDRTDDTPHVLLGGTVLAAARRLVVDAVFLKASLLSPTTSVRHVSADIVDLAECVALAHALGGAPFETPVETDGALTKGEARKLRRLARDQAEQARAFLEDNLTEQARRRVDGILGRAELVHAELKAGRRSEGGGQ